MLLCGTVHMSLQPEIDQTANPRNSQPTASALPSEVHANILAGPRFTTVMEIHDHGEIDQGRATKEKYQNTRCSPPLIRCFFLRMPSTQPLIHIQKKLE